MVGELKPFLILLVFGNIENLILAAQGVSFHVNPLGLACLSLLAVLFWLCVGTFGTQLFYQYVDFINFIGGFAIFVLGLQAMVQSVRGE